MSLFDDRYDIRRVEYEEIGELQEYIRKSWKSDHILGNNTEFFLYEYYIDNKVNFVIAKDRSSRNIVGMIGYIRASRDEEHLDIWPTMWKVSDGTIPLLGIELYRRLLNVSGARSILGCGNNPSTSSVMLNIVMKYKNERMKHYYRLSTKCEKRIAIINHDVCGITKECFDDNSLTIEKIEDIGSIEKVIKDQSSIDAFPYKDTWYYTHRFINHPIYDYSIWKISHSGREAILITREQNYNNSKAFRIVEYLGSDNLFSKLDKFFSEILDEYEYTDIYEYGMDDDSLVKAGFTLIEDDDTNIIPNHFSPYEPVNTDIWVSYSEGTPRFFKADGDQDRP